MCAELSCDDGVVVIERKFAAKEEGDVANEYVIEVCSGNDSCLMGVLMSRGIKEVMEV